VPGPPWPPPQRPRRHTMRRSHRDGKMFTAVVDDHCCKHVEAPKNGPSGAAIAVFCGFPRSVGSRRPGRRPTPAAQANLQNAAGIGASRPAKDVYSSGRKTRQYERLHSVGPVGRVYPSGPDAAPFFPRARIDCIEKSLAGCAVAECGDDRRGRGKEVITGSLMFLSESNQPRVIRPRYRQSAGSH